jgi:hypothetical protein
MVAAIYDKFVIEQGATFSAPVTVYNDLARTDPVDLTGYTARMMVRSDYENPTALVSLTTENGRITLGGAAGTITLLISATDTAGFTKGDYVYDLELVSGATVTRVLQGKIKVSRESTR